MEFEGKVAIVTGGGQGIGRGCTEALAEKGATVVITQRTAAKGEKCAEELRAAGYNVEYVQVDMRDDNQVNALFDHVMKKYGRLDFLVNNAGISSPAPDIFDVTQEMWDDVIATNLDAPMLCAQRAQKEMVKSGGGKIINIASLAGINGGDSSPINYAASKGALIGLTRCLSNDFRSEGVSVNNLALGVVKTAIWDGAPDEIIDAVSSKIRAGRMGTPEECGKICAFMCSEGADFLEGITVLAHGGVRNVVY